MDDLIQQHNLLNKVLYTKGDADDNFESDNSSQNNSVECDNESDNSMEADDDLQCNELSEVSDNQFPASQSRTNL